ncbi:TOMM precursor leader peptide-binding protein [Nocardioides abyssi]|uniref:TOMM leader peptide-binding protein n=1 Tax=Nocardioides abyssi TaxID=3058370 RepID=A0ABT8EZV9_9ACTN|nr:TOMM precursor leader peptide-binding protein [Nocardioides abyssi]MDN4163578.1 TOMM precursor leader peptide-binding protein [Nocardioides abyssi]
MSRTLRPGLVVARRDDGHLQVGLDPPTRVVLPDSPEVRRVLTAVARATPPPAGPVADRVVTALESAGLLVDPAPRATVAGVAARARHGDDAARRLAARSATTVSVDAPPELLDQVHPLLRAAGLATATPSPATRGGSSVATRPDATVVHLVLSTGPVLRERLDGCLRAGVPHLPVAGRDGGCTVGPFVVPGRTGCLRCADARLAETDPRRAVVLEQVARAPAPAPDPVVLALALAWAVRDLVAWAEGDRPSTWGAAYELGGVVPVRTPVDVHPHCGCAWADLGAARTA